MARFCAACGAAIDENARFCGACGGTVGTVGQVAPPSPVQAPPPASFSPPSSAASYYDNRGSKAPWVLVGVVAVLIAAAAAFGFLAMKQPGDEAARQTETEAVGPEVVKYAISDANIRNMATAKGLETRVVGSVKRGTQVKGVMHTGENGTNYWFKLSDGRGYISAVNLGDAAPAAGEGVAVASGTRAPVRGAPFCQVAVQSGNLRIRAAPDGPIVGGMPKGARFQAFNSRFDPVGAEWYQVQPFETRYPVGWVSADFVVC